MAMLSSPTDAESLFRSKKIPEIRAVESATKLEIEQKKEELRQLVGKSYRDLIDSADTIVHMKTSAESIFANLDSISASVRSLSASASPSASPGPAPDPARARIYSIASRVKYLVDTPESIWGCLDESMLLEASGRYLRAREVHSLIVGGNDHRDVVRRFPLLRHQWQIVQSFKGQISQRSRERLMDQGLTVGAYADALAAVATIDDLDPKLLLDVFLESRRSWISQKHSGVSVLDPDSVVSVLCEVVSVIRLTLGQVGELFVQVLNDLPLFYKTVMRSPPGTQLYGGIPNPDEEVRRWKLLTEKLESVTVILEPEYVAQCASSWLKGCSAEIFGVMIGGRHLIDAIANGEALGVAERLIRETLDNRKSLDGSLEQWLRSVFGSEIESPWDQIRGLILKDGKDVFEDELEESLVKRMKKMVHLGFQELSMDVNVGKSFQAIVADPGESGNFQAYLREPSTGGGIWFLEPNHKNATTGYGLKPYVDENDFRNCLNAYFGTEVSRIRDAVDNRCGMILEDLLSFMETHNSTLRLRNLAPYIQDKCYKTISSILQGLEDLLGQLSASMENSKEEDNSQPSLIVKRSLFIGRLLFALRNHSVHIPLILGSPKQWVKDTSMAIFGNSQQPFLRNCKVAFDAFGPQSPRGQSLDSPKSPRRQPFENPRRHTISTAAALFSADDNFRSKFDELNMTLRELCIKAHNIWISWVSDELTVILSRELRKDDALFATAPLKGWQVTMVQQEDSSQGPLEMKIALPFMPSLYVSSFLFQGCQQIHKIGGHVLDKLILQNFAWKLFEKMLDIYQSFISEMDTHEPRISDKGILQLLLDLRFAADILSGGKDSSSGLHLNLKEDSSKATILKSTYRRRWSHLQPDSAVMERVMGLIHTLSQKLDPIDWAIYESYLWENEKQSYKRYSVLFGFLVQLNHMYTDTVQKLPTKSNTESNILRCSSVPRFKYLPISAPALSSRGTHKSSLFTSAETSPRSPWNRYSTGEQTLNLKQEFDDDSGFDLATPLFRSFMTQVGSKFGESTSRLGSMLTDSQVGRFRDRSAAAMSTFGDMLPGPAAGLLSSFTAGVGRSDI